MIITGIGSRDSWKIKPCNILEFCEKYSEGNILRSGEATGSDQYFRNFWKSDQLELYLPWETFNEEYRRQDIREDCYYTITPQQIDGNQILLKDRDIIDLSNRSDKVKSLHCRNVLQILGKDVNTPSDVVVYCAPETNNRVSGGTRTAVELARQMGIPTFNLNNGIPDLEEINKDVYF